MTDRQSPTVIVARTVPVELEDAFGAWVTKLITAAYRYPGYVSAGIERPNATHPDQWLVVYRFDTGPSLQAWLDSDIRRELLDEGSGLFVGDEQAQVVAGVAPQDEVRVVTSYRLVDGTETEHIIVHQRMLDVLEAFPGFIRRDVLDAVPGIQDETVVTLTFDTRQHLLAWMDSPEREQFVNEIDGLVEGDLTTSVVGGFAGWFPQANSKHTNPRWKQAVVVMIALYPTVLFTSWVGDALWADWNFFLAILIGNLIGVSILTWLLMPPLTRFFGDWLTRR